MIFVNSKTGSVKVEVVFN